MEGLARPPVTKSFWRINNRRRHSGEFSPAPNEFKSVWQPRWHWSQRGRVFFPSNLCGPDAELGVSNISVTDVRLLDSMRISTQVGLTHRWMSSIHNVGFHLQSVRVWRKRLAFRFTSWIHQPERSLHGGVLSFSPDPLNYQLQLIAISAKQETVFRLVVHDCDRFQKD